MSLQLILKLKRIGYSGDSIGRDLLFAFQIENTVMNLSKRVQLGKKTSVSKSVNEILFTKDISQENAITLPINVTITEQDPVYDDTGFGSTVFSIKVQNLEKQTHSFSTDIVAEKGSDKGRKATFTFTLEAEIFDKNLADCLQKFETGIGEYSATELSDALITVFGELSSELHNSLSKEAEAIASTIFNRRIFIKEARRNYEKAKEKLERANEEFKKAIARHSELGNNLTKYKRELGDEEYNRQLAEAKEKYNEARSRKGSAQKEAIDCNSKKIQAESFVSKYKRNKSVTLKDIVALHKQYEGTRTGKKYVREYPKWSRADQKRNCERWKTAKAALEKIAGNPSLRKKYFEFRSNRGGERTLNSRETRIGGNDFW